MELAVSQSSKHKLRVLFVDDDESISGLLESELPRMGHTATICRSPGEAIEAVSKNTFDAAIVDLRMPGGSGWDVIDQLREHSPETDYVISTGHGSMDDAIRAIRMGAYDFLPKPVSLFEISAVLQRIGDKKSLQNKNTALESRLKQVEGRSDLIGESKSMERVKTLIEKIAPTDSAVLILGETGTGKEMVARRVHEQSERADAPFVAVNCGAIPENLVESEFFGHRKGAFTGADTARTGLFEVANGGTLFLDELGELDKSMQVKLLRFLESGEVRRVGENEPFRVDVRIVCATNCDLQEMVEAGTFREDLVFRVNTFEIHLPPLRERRDDIPALARHLIARHLKRETAPESILAPETIALLKSQEWAGNVRQLANVMEHAMILSDGKCIMPEDLPRSMIKGGSTPSASSDGIQFGDEPRTLREMEDQMILHVLEKHEGDKPSAAKELGIALKTLYNRLGQLEQCREAG
ncbi:Nitrogen regulation protein NR(I) [Fuerstiella marisgermanici]|uniref:Nitrogen regulation protein NR(I) n=1 Tax=Fuerstiella marisgermanici TaxID=1891926 RepID=A0A1P8W983_9PLAN|nr:Nitrogen regulation protein NR(I) [Fuerstiella marisgermanici]